MFNGLNVNQGFMKAKFIPLLGLCLSLLLCGCKTTFTNLTPQQVPQNPSGIYTLSFAAKIGESDVAKDSIEGFITIDGERHPMRETSPGSRVFEYEYAIPQNRQHATYFYEMQYKVNVHDSERERYAVSEYQNLQLTNRYVISMQSSRGPVGAEIPVVGRGFSRYDRILFNNYEADTYFASSVALSFIVPPLEADQDYAVTLVTGNGEMPVGMFYIDSSNLHVEPSSLELVSGEQRVLLFSIPRPAPSGGLLIEDTTDIPASVIMPEILIPEGAKTKFVRVQAGDPGDGSLFVSAPGFKKLEIPVRVKPEPVIDVIEPVLKEAETGGKLGSDTEAPEVSTEVVESTEPPAEETASNAEDSTETVENKEAAEALMIVE